MSRLRPVALLRAPFGPTSLGGLLATLAESLQLWVAEHVRQSW